MDLTLPLFLGAFDSVWAKDSRFLVVAVEIDGNKELIVNPRWNYEAKKAYYAATYMDDLTHKHAPNVRIVDFDFVSDIGRLGELLHP